MSVPVRAIECLRRATRRTHGPIKVTAAALALIVGASACGSLDSGAVPLPLSVPGQPAGTIVVPTGADVPTVVQRVRDAITSAGGSVLTVVDHTANARVAGVEIPPTTEVIGGPPAAGLPLLRLDQRAGANLPQHYLVRQGPDGSVTLTTNSAEYLAAVSQITPNDASTALHDSTGAVLNAVAPGNADALPTALVGVTPFQYLVTLASSADIGVTVDRLRRAADRAPTRSVAVLDMAAGSAEGGPPIRPTSVVLATLPEVEAALVAAAPSIGVDLPLRYVVWRDEQNRTQIGYPDVRRIALRHGVNPDDPTVVRLVSDADRLARLGAGVP
jgi:uncharacterized protein (DUF302 family)